jgi:hypothetical protein
MTPGSTAPAMELGNLTPGTTAFMAQKSVMKIQNVGKTLQNMHPAG